MVLIFVPYSSKLQKESQKNHTMSAGRLQRSDTAASPARPRTGRRLSLQPQPSLQPSLSPPSSRFRRSPSPTPPKARTTVSTPTKGPSKLGYKVMILGQAKVCRDTIAEMFDGQQFFLI